MRQIFRSVIFILFFGLYGCSETDTMSETNSEPKRVVYDSMENLDELIVIPATPNSVKWSKSQVVPGSRDSGITALFHFSPENYEKIIQNSEKHDVITDAIVGREFYEEWAPEEVKKEFKTEPFSDLSVSLVDRPALRPNLFVDLDNGTSPYIHGNIYPIGNGYIIVSLSTM